VEVFRLRSENELRRTGVYPAEEKKVSLWKFSVFAQKTSCAGRECVRLKKKSIRVEVFRLRSENVLRRTGVYPAEEKKSIRVEVFRLRSENVLRRTGVYPAEEKKYPCGSFPSSLRKRASPDGSVSGGRK